MLQRGVRPIGYILVLVKQALCQKQLQRKFIISSILPGMSSKSARTATSHDCEPISKQRNVCSGYGALVIGVQCWLTVYARRNLLHDSVSDIAPAPWFNAMRHQLRPPGRMRGMGDRKEKQKENMRSDGRFDKTSGGGKEGAVAYRLPMSREKQGSRYAPANSSRRRKETLQLQQDDPAPDCHELRHTGHEATRLRS